MNHHNLNDEEEQNDEQLSDAMEKAIERYAESHPDIPRDKIEEAAKLALKHETQMTIDTDETWTVEVPVETVAHLAFAVWAGELGVNDIGERQADEAATNLREELVLRLADEYPEVAKATKQKMAAYGHYFKREMSDTDPRVASLNASADELPDEVVAYLEEHASDGIGAVDMADPEMPDEVREFFEDYLREEGYVGGDDETSEFTGSVDPAYQ